MSKNLMGCYLLWCFAPYVSTAAKCSDLIVQQIQLCYFIVLGNLPNAKQPCLSLTEPLCLDRNDQSFFRSFFLVSFKTHDNRT